MTKLNSFSVTFTETFPTFTRPALSLVSSNLFVNDTRTVAIIGLGKRTEILIGSAKGDGTDGLPQNYDQTLTPSGRYFRTAAYPVDASTFEVFRGIGGNELVTTDGYFFDSQTGSLVLYTPLNRGERLVVSYVSTVDVNFPRLFTRENEEDLYTIYGSPSTSNTLSAAAQIAFANGCPRIIAVQGDHTGIDTSWFGAYSALENAQVYMIVPVQNGYYSETVVAGVDHAQRMSDTPSRRERFIIAGENPTSNEDDFDRLVRDDASDFAQEERIIIVGADFPRTVIAGETTNAYGGYLAAAVAGKWSSYEYIPTTLLQKELLRIQLNWPNTNLYSEAQKREIADNGVTLLLNASGAVMVGRFVTTLQTGNPVEIEPSIWRIRDYVAITLREKLENRFVGNVVLERIVNQVEVATRTHLQSLIDQKIITKFKSVRVVVDSLEPRQIDVAFDIEPAFPLNDILLTITITSSL